MRWVVLACAVVIACRSAPAPAPVSTVTPGPRPVAEPAPGKVKVVTETAVEILDPIKFLPGAATIEPASIPMLDAVARTLTGNPSIGLVAVQAFGADTVAVFQTKLGASRAQAIVDELIARGVERKRLLADGAAQPPSGYPNAPIFLILERAP